MKKEKNIFLEWKKAIDSIPLKQKNNETMKQNFEIKEKGKSLVAISTEDKKKIFGKINLETGKFIGDIVSLIPLTAEFKKRKEIVSKTYKLWITIEEHIVMADGSDQYRDMTEEDVRSVGEFKEINDATEQMNVLGNIHQSDGDVEN